MSAEVQIELTKRIIRDWARSDDCSGVDALIAIMEILDFNPYTWEPSIGRRTQNSEASAASAHAATGGSSE